MAERDKYRLPGKVRDTRTQSAPGNLKETVLGRTNIKTDSF